MSYDFLCFRPRSGEDPLTTAHAIEQEEEDIQARGPDELTEARKRALADALIAKNPALTPFALEYDQIAEFRGITVEEAKRKYTYIELDGPDDGPGIQITLYDEYATVTVPYWHTGAKAQEVFEEIWEYLRVIRDKAEFVIFDPQVERILDLDRDRECALATYLRVMRQMPELARGASSQLDGMPTDGGNGPQPRTKKRWRQRLFGP